MHLMSITGAPAFDFAQTELGYALSSFFHSSYLLRVRVRTMTMQRWPDS
jgi:hypothetical protein